MPHTFHPTRSFALTFRSLTRKRRLHVYTFGEGFLGCLGHGDFLPRDRALRVEALAHKDVRCISAGWTHSAAVCADGELLVWGRPFDMKQPLRIWGIQRFLPFVVNAINSMASKKELLSSPVSVPIGSPPQPVAPSWSYDPRPSAAPYNVACGGKGQHYPITSSLSNAGVRNATPGGGGHAPAPDESLSPTPRLKAVSVACSAGLTVVLGEDGRVYCMGYNRWGQCGQGPENVFTIFEPLCVGGNILDDERVTSLAVGFQQVLVLCESGRVYGWGKSLRGQLGIGGEMVEIPVPVELPGKVVELRSGFSHAVAILENGDVYVWGKMQSTEVKSDGRLPVYHDQLYPRKVDIGDGGRAVEAFCSSFSTLLRMEDGRMLMFGLEADTRRNVQTPVEVDLPPTASGSFFYGFNDIILRSRGDGSPSGPGLFKLSLTSNGASVSPFSLPGIDRNRHVEAVSVGWQHTLALVK